MSFSIQGTPKQLVEAGLMVNGIPVTQQMISVLVKIGACEDIGPEERPQGAKGPAARVYRFGAKKQFKFAAEAPKQEETKREENKEETKTPASKEHFVAMLPAIPKALESVSEGEIEAMILGLQALHAFKSNSQNDKTHKRH